jgi:pyruvate/2-oxoglutarate dehydrogenase complex dihydrolipoamide dehydrogenase (E3) component
VPYRPPLPAGGEQRPVLLDATAAILDPDAVRGPALVADWGGGWTGLDAAETLAAHGVDVTLACAAAAIGEGVHQYQRNLYLARLDRLGVRLVHHTEVVAHDGAIVLRHVFSGREQPLPDDLGTLVLAHGRVPDDALWPALEGRPACVRAGDVLGPRSAEEAILEGTLAAREVVSLSVPRPPAPPRAGAPARR